MTETRDLSRYIEFASDASKSIVAKTVVGPVEVSTVFSALPKFASDPVGTYFETMIFDLAQSDEITKEDFPGWPDEIMVRTLYQTYQKAEESHRYIVQALTQYFEENSDALSPCEL